MNNISKLKEIVEADRMIEELKKLPKNEGLTNLQKVEKLKPLVEEEKWRHFRVEKEKEAIKALRENNVKTMEVADIMNFERKTDYLIMKEMFLEIQELKAEIVDLKAKLFTR